MHTTYAQSAGVTGPMGYGDGDALQHAADALQQAARQLEYVWRSHYQYSPVFSIGGPTASYTLRNPFDSPAEYCVVAVSFGDIGSVSIQTGENASSVATTDTLDPSISLPRIVLESTAPTFIETWQDVGPGQGVTVATSISNSKNAIVCLRFRRRMSQSGFAAQSF